MSVFLEDIPLLPPPLGQVSNFINPETRAPIVYAISSLCLAIMWPIFLLRLYSKVWIAKAFGFDDVTTILAVIGSTCYAGGAIWGMNVYGPHGWNVRALDFTPYFINSITRYFVYVGIAISAALYTATTIFLGVQCVLRPGELWMMPAVLARCSSTKVINYIHGIFGIISDLYIFILPMPILWKLHMPMRKKVGVMAIFATGLLAILASILGLYFRVLVSQSADISWNVPPVIVLAMVEMTVGVMCGSVPHLPAFFRKHHLQLSQMLSFRYVFNSRKRRTRGSHDSSELKIYSPDSDSAPLVNDQPMYLETNVLGSIQGSGKFLRSGNFSLA